MENKCGGSQGAKTAKKSEEPTLSSTTVELIRRRMPVTL